MSNKFFMFMDNVKGSCTDTNHEGWIALNSVDFDVERIIEFKLHHEKMMPETSNPAISKIMITKNNCTASAQLFNNLGGLNKCKLIIDVVHEKGDGIVGSIVGSGSTRFESEVCFVSKFKFSAASDSLEKLELTVSSLTMTYNPPMDSHQLDAKSSSGYHFQRLRPL